MKNCEWLAYAGIGTTHNNRYFIIKSASPGSEKESDKIDVAENEIEEDELISCKKHLEISNYFSTIFSTHPTGYFFHNLKKSLNFFEGFSYGSSYGALYLRLLVVRI